MELGYANCQRASAKPVIKHFRHHSPRCHRLATRFAICQLRVATTPPPTLAIVMAIYDTEMLSDSPKLHMRKMLEKVLEKSRTTFTVT